MRKINSGFTVVELLIVIVVIGILVTIGVVSYSGYQERAERTAVQTDLGSISNAIDLFRVTNNTYPTSVSNCAVSTATELCLPTGLDPDFTYTRNEDGGSGYRVNQGASYDLSVSSDNQFIYNSKGEKTGGNEFMQYANLAPYIDAYGLKEYQLSFDIKSDDISTNSTARVYFQNGSTTRYTGLNQTVTVTEEYTSHTLTFTPTLSNSGESQALLAFYGTGNRLTVKNVTFQLKP